jgi:hypothetical protein
MCPFRYRRKFKTFSFGVSPEFMDRAIQSDDWAGQFYNKQYPTCWDRFLHWVGWK